MKKYTSYEIQDISSTFRGIARRLSRTDYSQCDANLKRFMDYIKTEPLIQDFIETNNVVPYDIEKMIKARYWLDPFEVSPDFKEEISMAVQMLQYAVEHFDGDFTRLYGTHTYTSAKSTVHDEMRKFIEHIIDPLIDHIGEYLHRYYETTIRQEEAMKPASVPTISAQNSTVVVGSTVDGSVSNTVTISEEIKENAEEIIKEIKFALDEEDIANKDDINDLLKQIQDELKENKKPRKGILTALKTLCKGGAIVIPLVTALIQLLNNV